jgi:hypothetical protein
LIRKAVKEDTLEREGGGEVRIAGREAKTEARERRS